MPGKPFLAEHQVILERYAGKESAAEIGVRTGHSVDTIKKRIQAAGLPSYVGARKKWTRRDKLMSAAAGLHEDC